jgi:hypothetical protein
VIAVFGHDLDDRWFVGGGFFAGLLGHTAITAGKSKGSLVLDIVAALPDAA